MFLNLISFSLLTISLLTTLPLVSSSPDPAPNPNPTHDSGPVTTTRTFIIPSDVPDPTTSSTTPGFFPSTSAISAWLRNPLKCFKNNMTDCALGLIGEEFCCPPTLPYCSNWGECEPVEDYYRDGFTPFARFTTVRTTSSSIQTPAPKTQRESEESQGGMNGETEWPGEVSRTWKLDTDTRATAGYTIEIIRKVSTINNAAEPTGRARLRVVGAVGVMAAAAVAA